MFVCASWNIKNHISEPPLRRKRAEHRKTQKDSTAGKEKSMSKAAKNLSSHHSTPRWSSFNLSLVIFYLSCRITISYHSAEPLENCWIAKACRVDSMRLDGSAHTLAASNPISRSIISLNVFNIECDSLEHRQAFHARLRKVRNPALHSTWLCIILHHKFLLMLCKSFLMQMDV